MDPSSHAMAGVFVTVRALEGSYSVSALTDAEGSYAMNAPPGDSLIVLILYRGDTLATTDVRRAPRVDLAARRPILSARLHPSSWWLSNLPDGEEKRKFILDCTGCHQFNETRVDKDGARRSKAQWAMDTRRMLGYAGAGSGFPVIAADRDPDRTAEWLTAHLSAQEVSRRARQPAPSGPRIAHAEVVEYDLPVPSDLPHDIALDDSGRVLVTGMFTHVIYRLDPASGAAEPVAIPVEQANPRAIEIDRRGNWWVLLGAPKKIARYAPAGRKWVSWDIGLYGHSIAPSPQGTSVWFNGHFTRDPEVIGKLDPSSGSVERFEVPSHPTLESQGGPVPYELRLAPDGTIWMSELQGDRLVRLDPRTRNTRVFVLPETWAGPRRFDVDAHGDLWIPGYSSGALWKLEAKTGTFRRYAIPVKDALPYVARVSPRDGRVWIGTGAADAVLAFDPRDASFTMYPLPTRGATVRHLVVDPSRGDVWLAYGASPALHPARIARLRLATAGRGG